MLKNSSLLRFLILALVSSLLSPILAAQERILFIRGGSGTGGFLGNGSDGHLSDIFDHSTQPGNHGFGEFRLHLESLGFIVEQVIEGPASNNTKIDFGALDLSIIDIIVFGSNNADYDASDREIIAEWVCRGGAALFISDANWGRDWCDAASSDQTFLDAFDLTMNQDAFLYASRRSEGDYVIGGDDRGDHPILAGPGGVLGDGDDVDAFDGEGVSPLTVDHNLETVDPIVLARAEMRIHVNDDCDSGSLRDVTVDDGALVCLEFGGGRVAGHFDRNTFFNLNGAGTNINREDNRQYATNLFGWLASTDEMAYGAGCPDAQGRTASWDVDVCPRRGRTITLALEGGAPGADGWLILGTGRLEGSGCALLVASPVLFLPIQLDGSGKWELSTDVPVDAPVLDVTTQVFLHDPGDATPFATSNGLELPVF